MKFNCYLFINEKYTDWKFFKNLNPESAAFKERNIKIGKDVKIGDNTRIGNNVTIKDDSHIGEYSYIGKGSKIECQVTIRNWSTVGAGSRIRENTIIGEEVKIGRESDIGKNSNIKNRSIVISVIDGYKYPANAYYCLNKKAGIIRLGCHRRTLNDWEKDFNNNTTEFPIGSIQLERKKAVYNFLKVWLEINYSKQLKG